MYNSSSTRPIPIKSPRDLNQQKPSRSASRISHSVPVPASPHFGSLKAPPEFLSGMPPLELPMSFQESERLHPQKDLLAKSAPAFDLAPLHRYRVEDRRKSIDDRRKSVDIQLASSYGDTENLLSALRVEDDVHLSGDVDSPKPEEAKGILLTNLQKRNIIHDVAEEPDEGLPNGELEDDELQFDLS